MALLEKAYERLLLVQEVSLKKDQHNALIDGMIDCRVNGGLAVVASSNISCSSSLKILTRFIVPSFLKKLITDDVFVLGPVMVLDQWQFIG